MNLFLRTDQWQVLNWPVTHLECSLAQGMHLLLSLKHCFVSFFCLQCDFKVLIVSDSLTFWAQLHKGINRGKNYWNFSFNIPEGLEKNASAWQHVQVKSEHISIINLLCFWRFELLIDVLIMGHKQENIHTQKLYLYYFIAKRSKVKICSWPHRPFPHGSIGKNSQMMFN